MKSPGARLAVTLPQHPDQHRPQRPVLLAVDQQLEEARALSLVGAKARLRRSMWVRGYAELEWAALWKLLPKVVFSTTLSAVQGHARLASGGLAEEIERLRPEPGEGDIAIGGATLAAEAASLSLIDEYRPMVYPVLVGGGIPFFPNASAGWMSNSSRPEPSAPESSTSATACLASRFVRRAPRGRLDDDPERSEVNARRARRCSRSTCGART